MTLSRSHFENVPVQVDHEIQSILSEDKLETLRASGVIRSKRVRPSAEDPRFRLRKNSLLLKRARSCEELWSDPKFWMTLRKAGEPEALEYAANEYDLSHHALISLVPEIGCHLNELVRVPEARLRFFEGLIYSPPEHDAEESRAWFNRVRRKVFPIIERYLAGPRYKSKRQLLRTLLHDDLAELHLFALRLAEDTEDMAMGGSASWFPDVRIKVGRGNRKSKVVIQKTEWMVDRLLEDPTLSDVQLSQLHLRKFGTARGKTKEEIKSRGLKSTPGSLRQLAADARKLVEFRHGYLSQVKKRRRKRNP